jgi:hypothetical protein
MRLSRAPASAAAASLPAAAAFAGWKYSSTASVMTRPAFLRSFWYLKAQKQQG